MESFQADKQPTPPSSSQQEPVAETKAIHAQEAEKLGQEASTHADVSKDKAAHSAEAAKEAAKEAGHAAVAAAGEAKEVVIEKTAGMVEAVKSTVKEAVDFVKEHAPPVEHTEPTPAEQQTNALMNEAAALVDAQDTSVPAAGGVASTAAGDEYRVINVDEPTLKADTTTTEGATPTPASHETTGAATDYKKDVEVGPFVKPEYMEDVRKTAPEEVVRNVEKEERSAKGPMQAAKDYVREHVGHHHDDTHSQHVKEWRALPGDIHIPLLSRAYREKIEPVFHHRDTAHTTEGNKHKEPWAGVKMPGYADEPQYTGTKGTHTTTTTTRPATTEAGPETGVEAYLKSTAEGAKQSMHSTGETSKDIYHRASDEVAHKTAAAEEKAKELYHSVEEKAKEAAHRVEDKVKDVYEEMELRQAEMQPKTVEEARLAHGEIPSNTEEVLHGHKPEA